jgi:hypothetical protein
MIGEGGEIRMLTVEEFLTWFNSNEQRIAELEEHLAITKEYLRAARQHVATVESDEEDRMSRVASLEADNARLRKILNAAMEALGDALAATPEQDNHVHPK